MLLDPTTIPSSGTTAPPPGLRHRLAEHRRLRRIDRTGVRLARVTAVGELLGRVELRLAAGWTQDAWFETREHGILQQHVGVLRAEQGVTSERACLVAAVAVEALPGSITSGAAQRTIGSMWSVLHGGSAAAAVSSASGGTAAHAYDLVRWNDAPDRRAADVLALVDASRSSVARTASALRSDLATA